MGSRGLCGLHEMPGGELGALARGLDPATKSLRLANYIITLRRELLALAKACGASHPCLVDLGNFEILTGRFRAVDASRYFGYQPAWCARPVADVELLNGLMADLGSEYRAEA